VDTQRLGGYPVSVKGVVVRDGRVLLLRNDRQEWELPGGRLELGETPPQCVVREITEETGWTVEAGPILDAWMYFIEQVERNVFVVTYGCHLSGAQDDAEPVLSFEHQQIGLFTEDEVAELVMPQGYKTSIATWFAALRAGPARPVGPLEASGESHRNVRPR
jgi:8-oxo-dGTP pyrophosphatase MutT (NUDIX family)